MNAQRLPFAPPSSGCKTVIGMPCVFPFKYGGILYNECTKVESVFNKPWCSVQTDAGKNTQAEKWGYCAPDCPAKASGYTTTTIIKTTSTTTTTTTTLSKHIIQFKNFSSLYHYQIFTELYVEEVCQTHAIYSVADDLM